jgi:pimeloyl-ACP methyl ester carboxylesterase
MAADVRVELDEPVDLLGFSMGGYVALTLALSDPNLVRSLVLAGTGAGGAGRVPRPAHVARAFDEAFGLPHEEFGRRTMPYTLGPGWSESNPERFEEILAARLERPTPYETILGHVAACYAFYDLSLEVERIDAPALVIHGDADVIVPVENGRSLAERLANAEYVELPGRGHNLMLEDPETFAQLVTEFVRGLS